MELLIKLIFFLTLVSIGYWRGRRNEREHLRRLAEEEKRVAHVLIFATRYPDQVSTPMDPILVSGSAVIASDYFRLFLASLRKIVGGNFKAYESLLERGRRQAIVRMKQAAADKGATMIFNVKFSATRISNNKGSEATQVEMLAYGTAFVPARGAIADSKVHFSPGAPLPDVEMTNLWKNRTSRKWLILWSVALIYFLVELLGDDSFAHQWRYVDDAPWSFILLLTGTTIVGFFITTKKKNLRLADRIIMGLLSFPVMTFALYFGLLRLNQVAGSSPIQASYEVNDQHHLAPINPSHPYIVFDDWQEYWDTQPKGKRVPLTIIKGGLGSDLVDIKPLEGQLRSYYTNAQ